jgi:hypothetical protein
MRPPNRNKGKPGQEVLLPNRAAMNKLIKGPPGDRTLLDIGELTPSGRKAPQTYSGIMKMGTPKIVK